MQTMTETAAHIRELAALAARGAGFEPHDAELFGKAVLWHLADGGDPNAVIRALADPEDSPIVRLPLVLADLQRASSAVSGPVELTLNPDDTDLALSYARLGPHAGAEVVRLPSSPPRLRLEPSSAAEPPLPDSAELPERLDDHFSALAERAKALQAAN